MQLGNITEGAARALHANVVFSKATTIQDATAAAKISTTGTIIYTIDGIFKTKAAIDDGAYSAGHDPVLDGYSCLFAFGLDAAGNLTTFQGQPFKIEVVDGVNKFRGYKANRDNNGVITGYVKELALDTYNCAFAPTIPPGYAVFAIGKVAASGANFVPGTTAHGTGNTATFTDVMAIPANTNL